MDYNLLIDRVQEALVRQGLGQKIWMQSATDREAGDDHAEGLAISVGPAEPADGARGEEVFAVVYFRVFPGSTEGGAEGGTGHGDCVVELGYVNPHHELEDAKAEALSLLPSLPRPAFLDRISDTDLAASSLEELEAPRL